MLENVKSLSQILSDESQPPAPIIDHGILLDNSLLLLYGQPKSRKSFLALNLALAISKGMSFAGFSIPSAQRVLVLSAEGGYYPTRERLRRMSRILPSREDDNLHVCCDVRANLREPINAYELKEDVQSIAPKVVVIDPLVRFHNANENSATEMAEVFSVIRALIEDLALSVVLVHHSGKDESKGARGSSAITGEYDTCIEISTNGLKSTLMFDTRHVETPDNRRVQFNPETFWFEDSSIGNPVVLALKVLGSNISRKELVKYLRSNNHIAPSTAYKHLADALARGLVKTEQGQYSLN